MDEDLKTRLAARVRAARQSRHWSLDRLAATAEISKGALVALEQGSGNPNLSTLCRLSEALQISVSSLLEYDSDAEIRVVDGAALTPLWRGTNGGWATLVLAQPSPQIELWRWHLLAGESYEAVPYTARAFKTVTVVDGQLVLSTPGGDTVVPAGSNAIFNGSIAHRYRAGDAVCDMFITTVLG